MRNLDPFLVPIVSFSLLCPSIGVFAGHKKIPEGTYIGIYSGELLTDDVAHERGVYVPIHSPDSCNYSNTGF